MSGPFARDVLLKMVWADDCLDELTVIIRSRGGQVPFLKVPGCTISKIGRSFMTFDDGTMVPFHRVESILKGNDMIWSRPPRDLDVKDHHVLGR